MKIFCALLLVSLISCATYKPKARTSISAKLLSLPKFKLDTNYVPTPMNHSVPWQYPPGIDQRLYCWTLESSTDMVHWVEVPNPSGEKCLDGDAFVTNSQPFLFFRLHGVR